MGWNWNQGGNVLSDDDYSPLTPVSGPLDLKMFSGRWPGLTRNEVKEMLERAKKVKKRG